MLPKSFINELFTNSSTGAIRDTIEEEDIIAYFQARSDRIDAFFDQDKILNYADEETGCITRQSFQQGIQNEIVCLNEELNEIATKQSLAALRFESLEAKLSADADIGATMPVRFLLKICCLDRPSFGRSSTAFSVDTTVKLTVSLIARDHSVLLTYATEERNIIGVGQSYFVNNVFTFIASEECEKICVQLWEKRADQVDGLFSQKGSTYLNLMEFADQTIHKRSYHLDPYDLVVKSLFIFDEVEYNNTKLQRRKETIDRINEELSNRAEVLRVRLVGIQEHEDERMLEHLGLICFESTCNPVTQKEFQSTPRASKEFDSETASIYTYEGQVAMLMDEEQEELCEFRRELPLITVNPDSAQVSFEKFNMNGDLGGDDDEYADIEEEFNEEMLTNNRLNLDMSQNKLRNYIGSQRQSRENSQEKILFQTPSASQKPSPKVLISSSQRPPTFRANDFISPRFNEDLISVGQRGGLDDLQALYAKTSHMIDTFNGVKKLQLQAERIAKCAVYDDIAAMDKTQLLRLRILSKGINALHRMQLKDPQSSEVK